MKTIAAVWASVALVWAIGSATLSGPPSKPPPNCHWHALEQGGRVGNQSFGMSEHAPLPSAAKLHRRQHLSQRGAHLESRRSIEHRFGFTLGVQQLGFGGIASGFSSGVLVCDGPPKGRHS